MTGPPASHLETLWRDAREEFDPNLSKADASRKIDQLQEKTGQRTSLAMPRRTATGFDTNRLHLLTAVLSRRTRLPLHDQDVLLTQQLEHEGLVVPDRIHLRIEPRKDVERTLRLHAADAGDRSKRVERRIALLAQPAAGKNELFDALPTTERHLHRVLTGHVCA